MKSNKSDILKSQRFQYPYGILWELPPVPKPRTVPAALPRPARLQVHPMRLPASTQQVLLLQDRRQVLRAQAPGPLCPLAPWEIPQKMGDVMETVMSWDFC